MYAAQTSERLSAAMVYAIVALTELVTASMLVSFLGWHGPEQVIQDFKIIGGTLLFKLGFCAVNILLALGAWRILRYSYSKRRLFLAASVIVAIVFVANMILGWWRWCQGALPPAIGPVAVLGQTLLALGYVLSAVTLIKVLLTAERLKAGESGPQG